MRKQNAYKTTALQARRNLALLTASIFATLAVSFGTTESAYASQNTVANTYISGINEYVEVNGEDVPDKNRSNECLNQSCTVTVTPYDERFNGSRDFRLFDFALDVVGIDLESMQKAWLYIEFTKQAYEAREE